MFRGLMIMHVYVTLLEVHFPYTILFIAPGSLRNANLLKYYTILYAAVFILWKDLNYMYSEITGAILREK